MARVFTNGLGDWGSIPGLVISKTQKKRKKGYWPLLSSKTLEVRDSHRYHPKKITEDYLTIPWSVLYVYKRLNVLIYTKMIILCFLPLYLVLVYHGYSKSKVGDCSLFSYFPIGFSWVVLKYLMSKEFYSFFIFQICWVFNWIFCFDFSFMIKILSIDVISYFL